MLIEINFSEVNDVKLLDILKNRMSKEIYTYSVRLKEIKIPYEFEQHKPNQIKMQRKWDYYRLNNELQSQIVINRDFVLVDGYTSYLIAKAEGIRKVDVIFAD